MQQVNVAILGATGAVGRTMLEVLLQRRFPFRQLRLLASEKSAGQRLECHGRQFVVEKAGRDQFEGMDIVLGAVDNSWIQHYLPWIRQSGALLIDNSSAFRMEPHVPLVIPEINAAQIAFHHGIIANPNCATILALMALWPLHCLYGCRRLWVSTYQAVSGAGKRGMEELTRQLQDPRTAPEVFPRPIAGNVIPQIGALNEMGISEEEQKLQREGRKILDLPSLQVSCTCVRVPVVRCHSAAIVAQTEKQIDLEVLMDRIRHSPGLRLQLPYPTPLEYSGSDLTAVGRLRMDPRFPDEIQLWCCFDQLRKGAATNAVQIAEWALEQGWLRKERRTS